MSKQAFFELGEEENKYIMELYNTCERMGLGNVSFQYYAVPGRMYEVFFYLTQYTNHWELVVKHEKQEGRTTHYFTDMYKIIDGNIEYDYSESDRS